jgi:PD-(D/E)XK nuclease superfamily
MSKYYNPSRTKNLYDPNSPKSFRLSRSKLDLFINCPRCFYLDRKLGIAQPPGYPFTLNTAVDSLLKKEFDLYRAKGETHPIMKEQGIDAIPLKHENINDWRDSMRKGITYKVPNTNIEISGGIDDVWLNPAGEYLIVDYKATSKTEEVNLDAEWQIAYKRQMEIYQWLFRQNGFTVSPIGYFVYCNADTGKLMFGGKLEFDIKIIPYKGDDSWVSKTVNEAIACLKADVIPASGADCDYCKYSNAVRQIVK